MNAFLGKFPSSNVKIPITNFKKSGYLVTESFHSKRKFGLYSKRGRKLDKDKVNIITDKRKKNILKILRTNRRKTYTI